MAESSSLPTPAGQPALRAASSEVRAGAGSPGDPVYRPLPVLAIVGVALACLYLLILVPSWLVAFFQGLPLQLSFLTLLIPVAGLIVSLLAWLQIRRSEGTLAGASLARLGMLGSGLLALVYVAYLAGSYLAVRGKSEEFALAWLDKLRNNQLDSAFLLTQQPGERPREDARLREALEVRFNNSPDPARKGPYGTFLGSELVRFIQRGGAETKFTPAGLREWTYQEGGYRVRQNIEARSPEGVCNIMLTLHGRDTPGKLEAGWTVIWGESGATPNELSPLGQAAHMLMGQAVNFVTEWNRKWAAGKTSDAFLDTVAPDRRSAVGNDYHAQAALAALAAGFAPDVEEVTLVSDRTCERYLPGFREFLKGNLVADLPPSFWAPDKYRGQVVAELRKQFRRPAEMMGRIVRVDAQRKPTWKKEGGRFLVELDALAVVHPVFVAEGTLFLETDASNLESASGKPAEWRVVGLELARARGMESFGPR